MDRAGFLACIADGEALQHFDSLTKAFFADAVADDDIIGKPILPFLEALFRACVADKLVPFIISMVPSCCESVLEQSDVCKSILGVVCVPAVKEVVLASCCNNDEVCFFRFVGSVLRVRKELLKRCHKESREAFAWTVAIEKLEEENIGLRAMVARLQAELRDAELCKNATGEKNEVCDKVIEVLKAQNDRLWELITKLTTLP